jgi:hypothetical protein
MPQNTKYISLGIAFVLIIGLIGFYVGKNSIPSNQANMLTPSEKPAAQDVASTTKPITAPENKISKPTSMSPAPSTTSSKKGFYSYANAEYNFTIQYPPYTQPRNSFSTFHEIGNNWRLYPSQANQGKGILELPIFTIDQGSISNGKQKYPLYFTAVVRVSVSPNTKECYAQDAGYTNQKITNITINGVPFKRFSTSDAAMMKYVQAESYRTIHNNQCFVIEQIKNGSNYRDEKMAPGISDTALAEYYNTGETIIKTFAFKK